jgi:hypothetical protein
MNITSPNFENNTMIPDAFTCDEGERGAGTSPALEFSGIPREAVSLVLTMHDPDIPKHLREDGNWDHWLVWNMSPKTSRIEAGDTPPGIQGHTTSSTLAYVSPCPPDGEHRYIFKLYALDTMLDLPPETTGRIELESAMAGHILETAELVGLYNKRENR